MPRFFFALLMCMILLCGCAKSLVTRDNFERIQPGMTRSEVEAILGPPTQDYQGILTWKSGERRLINVMFDDRQLVTGKDMEGL